MREDQYPKKLVKMLSCYSFEGYEIFTTNNEDSTVFIIVPADLDKWVVIIEWAYGEEFSYVNVNKDSFSRLHKVIHEIEGPGLE